MRELVRMAWRNTWRNWRRTVIALVAMVLGLVLLVFFDGIIRGSDRAIFGNAVRLYGGNVQVHAPGFREDAARMPLLPLDDADAVVAEARLLPDFVSAGKRIVTTGMVTSREATRPVTITGLEPDVEAEDSLIAEKMADGRYLMPEDEGAIVIGRTLADRLAVEVGDRVSVLGRGPNDSMRQNALTIVGIYDLGNPDAETAMTFATLGLLQSLTRLTGQATEVAVTLDTVGREEEAMSALQDALPGYEVDTWATLRPEIRQTMDTKMKFGNIFGFVVVVIASIGILNLLLMAVFERTREMGVLAALGMKSRQVTLLFLVEGTLIGLMAAVIGGVLGVALVWLVSRVGIDVSFTSGMGELSALMGDRIYPMTDIGQVVARGIAVTLIAMVASLYPAWLAGHREPADVLHHV